MSTLAKIHKPNGIRIQANLTTIILTFIDQSLPRRCMVISVGLLLAGLGMPILMIVHLLQPSFLLGLAGLALAASGGVLALIFCGEI
jgi:hypothetical protein